MARVQFVHAKSLEPFEMSTLRTMVSQQLPKLARRLGEVSAVVTTKKYSKRGSKPKYSFHVRLMRGSILLASKASDWDLRRCVHRVFTKLDHEAEHRFRLSGQKAEKLHPPMSRIRRKD